MGKEWKDIAGAPTNGMPVLVWQNGWVTPHVAKYRFDIREQKGKEYLHKEGWYNPRMGAWHDTPNYYMDLPKRPDGDPMHVHFVGKTKIGIPHNIDQLRKEKSERLLKSSGKDAA